MVEFPDAVAVEHKTDEMGVRYGITVATTDRGKVIGREGKNAEALRTILRSAGFQANIRASMLIIIPGEREYIPDGGEMQPERTFSPELHDGRKKPKNDYEK